MIRLAVRVSPEHAEEALAELLTLAPSGVEEVEHADGTIEYAVYGAEGEVPALPDLKAAIGGALVEVSTSEVRDDWAERWREFHRPMEIGGRLWVRPPWAAPAVGGLLDVAIEPAQAFGTGAHPTTRLCLELLLELEPGGALLDVGCGSGVLAIAAAKLGFGPVVAIDHEHESVTATLDNAAANGVTLEALRLDLRRDPLPHARTVLANLLLPLLLDLAPALRPLPARLIAGGLLVGQLDAAAQAFAEEGLRERERRVEGEWGALLLVADR